MRRFLPFVFLCLVMGMFFAAPGVLAYEDELFAITVKNNTATVYDGLQVRVDLSSVSGLGTNFEIIDKDGNSVPYCFEQSNGECGTNPTNIIWVRVPHVNSYERVYLLVKKTSSNMASNGGDVFDFYDDFNDGVKDNSLWYFYGTWNESNGKLILPSCSGWCGAIKENSAWTYTFGSIGKGIILEHKTLVYNSSWNYDVSTHFDFSDGDVANTNILLDYNNCNSFFIINQSVCGRNEYLHIETRNWHTYIFIIENNQQKLFIDGNPFRSEAWKNYSLAGKSIKDFRMAPKGGGEIDWVRVRKSYDNIDIAIINVSSQQNLYNTTHHYYLIPFGKTWSQAKSFCENELGGYLITITESSEQSILENLLSKLPAQRSTWIGLNDLASEGNFEWVTGETVSYTNWNSGEPNNAGGNEDCAHIWTNGLWNDNRCEDHPDFFFACEVGDYYEIEVNPTSLSFSSVGEQNIAIRTLNNQITSLTSTNPAFVIQAEDCTGLSTGTCSITVRYNGGHVSAQTGELRIGHERGTLVVSLSSQQMEPSFSWYNGKDTFTSYGETGKIVINNPGKVHIDITENSGAFVLGENSCDQTSCLVDVTFRPPHVRVSYTPSFTFSVPSEGLTYQLTGGESRVWVSLGFVNNKNSFSKYGETGAVKVTSTGGVTVELTSAPDAFRFDSTSCSSTYCELNFTFEPQSVNDTYLPYFEFNVVETSDTLSLTGANSQASISYAFRDGKDSFSTYNEEGAIVISNAGYNISVISQDDSFVLDDTDCLPSEDNCVLVFHFRPSSYSGTFTPEFQINVQETGEQFTLTGQPSSVSLSVSFRDNKKAYSIYNERGAVVIQNQGLLTLTVSSDVTEAFIFDDPDCSGNTCTCTSATCDFEFVFRPTSANQIYVPSFTITVDSTGETLTLQGVNSAAMYTAYFVGKDSFSDYGEQGTIRIANMGHFTLSVVSDDSAFKFGDSSTTSCTDEICELNFAFKPNAVNTDYTPTFTISDAETGQYITLTGNTSRVDFSYSIDKSQFSSYGETAVLTINKASSTVVNISMEVPHFIDLSTSQCPAGEETCMVTLTFHPSQVNTTYNGRIVFNLLYPTQEIQSSEVLTGRLDFRLDTASLNFEELHVPKKVKLYDPDVSYTYEVNGPFTVTRTDMGSYHEFTVTATDVGTGALRLHVPTGEVLEVSLEVNLVYTSSVDKTELTFTRAGDLGSVVVSLTNARITGLNITGSDKDYFELDRRCLNSTEDCRVWVKFKPSALRDYTATLEIQTTAGNHNVVLNGSVSNADAPIPCSHDTGGIERPVNKAFIIIDMMGNCKE